MQLKVDSSSEASALPFQLDRDVFKQAYRWGREFVNGTIKCLDRRFPESPVWAALHALLSRELICQTDVPAESLSSLADYFGEGVPASDLQDQWLALRPRLAARAPPAGAAIFSRPLHIARGEVGCVLG